MCTLDVNKKVGTEASKSLKEISQVFPTAPMEFFDVVNVKMREFPPS